LISVNLLPKDLRRVSEPVYWRLLTVLAPLVALGAMASLQYVAWSDAQARTAEVRAIEAQLVVLQPAIDELAEAQAQRRDLEALSERAAAIREGEITWSPQLTGLLATLPRTNTNESVIDFADLTLRTLDSPLVDPARYEGAPALAEATISGNVTTLDVLSTFIGNLESNGRFGVSFQSASERVDEEASTNRFTYSLTVGILDATQGEGP